MGQIEGSDQGEGNVLWKAIEWQVSLVIDVIVVRRGGEQRTQLWIPWMALCMPCGWQRQLCYEVGCTVLAGCSIMQLQLCLDWDPLVGDSMH